MDKEKKEPWEMIEFLRAYQKGYEDGQKIAFQFALKVVKEYLEENDKP